MLCHKYQLPTNLNGMKAWELSSFPMYSEKEGQLYNFIVCIETCSSTSIFPRRWRQLPIGIAHWNLQR